MDLDFWDCQLFGFGAVGFQDVESFWGVWDVRTFLDLGLRICV